MKLWVIMMNKNKYTNKKITNKSMCYSVSVDASINISERFDVILPIQRFNVILEKINTKEGMCTKFLYDLLTDLNQWAINVNALKNSVTHY